MKRISLIIITLLALLLAASTPARAKTTVEHLHIKGKSVFAEWQYTEGNIVTFVTAAASEEVVNAGGPGETQPVVTVSIFRFDTTTGGVIFSGTGLDTEFDLSIDNQLSTARLVADFIFFNFGNGLEDTMHIDLTWTATGDRVNDDSETVIFNEPGFHFNAHFNHVRRDAVATGSITTFGEEWLRGPATIGQIQDNKAGVVSVTFGD